MQYYWDFLQALDVFFASWVPARHPALMLEYLIVAFAIGWAFAILRERDIL